MNDYLDRVQEQLAELTERGAHQGLRARRAGRGGGDRPPRRRGSEALALLAAAAVVAAVVAIVLVNVHSGTPHRTAATTAHQTAAATHPTASKPPAVTSDTVSTLQASTTPATVPAHFAPQSFTAISEFTWWLLGPGTCASCGAIVRTTDGGRTFTGVHAPNVPLATSASATAGYSQLRFVDTKNGFAFGPDLYATHDGGASWRAVDLGGAVTDLAISGGQAFATVQPPGGNGRLMSAPVSSDTWSTISAAGAVAAGVWAQVPTVIVQSGVGTGIGGNVLVSDDGGKSFVAHPAPSPGLPCQFAAPNPPVVWAHCATGTESGVWRSTDAGARFTVTVGTGTSLPLPNSAAFAAASASTAVVGYQQLYRTSNDGALWNPVGPSGIAQWAYLAFTDSTHGVGLGYVGSVTPANERLYYTIDAGQSYHLVPIP